jgi:hypothetical protein
MFDYPVVLKQAIHVFCCELRHLEGIGDGHRV